MDSLQVFRAEIAKNFILACQHDKTPTAEQLELSAQLMNSENLQESNPIPTEYLSMAFRYARKIWRLPGYAELRKAWEKDEELKEEVFMMSARNRSIEQKVEKQVVADYVVKQMESGYFPSPDEFEYLGLECPVLQEDFPETIEKIRLTDWSK